MGGAGAIRHPIDLSALSSWISTHALEIALPLDVKQFGFGQSNPTYQLTSIPTGTKYVMRKKPPGKIVSAQAHKVEREYRIIAALQGTDVPVPKAICLCEDAKVIGTPFYIMSFLDGRIIEDSSMPSVTALERTAMWLDAARTLAKFHRVDPKKVGLEGYGKSTGFYKRQLATWKGICDAQARTKDVETGEPVGELPHFKEMMAFFADERWMPSDRRTLVHGDYKIDNMVFHKTEPQVIGILDWEMSTVGHPLSDLANLIAPFRDARMGRDSFLTQPAFLPGATPGLPTPEQIKNTYYSVLTAVDPPPGVPPPPSSDEERERELRWAEAFSAFRGAAICQGIAARQAVRQASSEKASQYSEMRNPMAEYAWKIVGEVKASVEKGGRQGRL